MSDDWEDLVIETGVDSVLDYLAENKKASVDELSSELGFEEDRVKEWADALSDEGLVEKHHTLKSGLVLEFTEENLNETMKKKQEAQREVNQASQRVEEELQGRSSMLSDKREELLDRDDELEEEQKKELVQDTISRLEKADKKIQREIRRKQVDQQTLSTISKVEKLLEDVERLIEKHLSKEEGEKLEEKSENVISDIEQMIGSAEDANIDIDQEKLEKQRKAVENLQDKIEKARKTGRGGKGIKSKLSKALPVGHSSDSGGILSKLEAFLPIEKVEETGEQQQDEETSHSTDEITPDNKINPEDVPEDSYSELLRDNSVTEVMRKLSMLKDPDYQALLRSEKRNLNRPELVGYLEERVDE